MGLRDAAEQLEVCRADTVQMEAALAEIRRRAEAQQRLEHPTIAAGQAWSEIASIARAAVMWKP